MSMKMETIDKAALTYEGRDLRATLLPKIAAMGRQMAARVLPPVLFLALLIGIWELA